MSSTFMGLETSKRGLSTQQSALYTVGHNISNANTLGYSRQRVNMEATMGFPGVGMNAPKIPGFLGTGVQTGSVQRIRDQFLDNQYRQETTKLGYWSSKSDSISQMEDVLSEPSEYGLNAAFDSFYSSFQELSTNPGNASARAVVVQRGKQLADSFNYINKQLTQIQSNLKNEMNVETNNVNSILKQIASLNEQIGNIEPNGYLPNDLYDARDQLVDQLSEYFNVSVDYTKSGGNALAIAEGSMNVYIKLNDGTKVQVINKNQAATITANGYNKSTDAAGNVSYTNGAFNSSEEFSPFTYFGVSFGGTSTNISHEQLEMGSGKMISLVHAYGYADDSIATKSTTTTTGPDGKPVTTTTYTWPNVAPGTDRPLADGTYIDKLEELDKLAQQFAETFNAIHTQGFTLANGATASVKGLNFFVDSDGNGTAGGNKISAATIKINDDIVKDLNLIAASSRAGEEGNGDMAILLSNIKSLSLDGSTKTLELADGSKITAKVGNLDGASAQTYYQGVVGQLGTDGQQANKMVMNSTTIQLSISNNRAAVSSVSLDEEMTDMIKFQQAYNASARMVTVVDETLDKIINGMGRVGL